MNSHTSTNSSSPGSPILGSFLIGGQSSTGQNSLETQFSFFRIHEQDFPIVKSNKEKITQLMKMLEKKGLLVAECLKDYVVKPFELGGQGVVYLAVEKKEHDSHLNPDGTYFGGKYVALKAEEFFLINNLEIKPRELELMSDKFHKSAIQAQKVFFEHFPEIDRYSVNIVMPWYKHTLMSWLLKEKNNKGHISQIKNNKRRFEEVRRMLTSILEGISMIHHRRNVHMDIKFDNILVYEFVRESQDEKGGNTPILIFEPIIADFGMVKDLKKETSSSSFIGFTKEFAAPEVWRDEKPLISPKADVYSFGVILYKIFIDENDGSFRLRNQNSNLEINSENIKKRIEALFPKDKDSISDSFIEDISKIINLSLEDNPESRPQAITLLLEHELFKLPETHLSEVTDFNIENTYEYGLRLLEGKNGYPKDFKKAREIFDILSNSFNHMPSKYFFGFMVCYGLGGKTDEKLGNEIMIQAATVAKDFFGSNSDALGFSEFAIGHIYCEGHNVDIDDSKTFTAFQQSSNKSNSFAQCWIGNLYFHGYGVENNLSLATDWYKKSAQKGNCIAQQRLDSLKLGKKKDNQPFNIGYDANNLKQDSNFEIEKAFENGLNFLEGKNGNERDNKKAREIFEKLANSFNHMPSKYFFGFMVCFGLGGKVDDTLGQKIMIEAAPASKQYFETNVDSLGFSDFAIGDIFYNGHNVPIDQTKALEFFQKSYKKENSFAQLWMAYYYCHGKDCKLGVYWYRKSANQGNCLAQYNLAVTLRSGAGIKQDDNEAFKWSKLSADEGYYLAQHDTGMHYLMGTGVAPDNELAIHYFRLAAEQGLAMAQFMLAKSLVDRLELGKGSVLDVKEAIESCEKAAAQGDKNAIRILASLKNHEIAE